MIVNEIYLNESTIGHIRNDPEAKLFREDGQFEINKNILKSLKSQNWNNNTKKLLNFVPENCILKRLVNKGNGWFMIQQLPQIINNMKD